MSQIGRNDPCPCGSGKKYKKCCLNNSRASTASIGPTRIRQVEGDLVHKLLNYSENKYSKNALIAAWEDFVLGRDISIFDSDYAQNYDLDPEFDDPFDGMNPEFETFFVPWFLFNWLPDSEPYFEYEEDLESYTFPAKRIINSYLERKQKFLPAFTLSFIEQACSQPFSFFLITKVIPGKQVTVKDIFLDQERTLDETQVSQSLSVGAVVFARVITLVETSLFFGLAPLMLPTEYHQYFIDFRQEIESTHGQIDANTLALYDDEFRENYFEIRENLMEVDITELHNSEDEPLISANLLYTLNCSLIEAFEALKTLSILPPQELLQEAKYNSQGELLSLEFDWLEKGYIVKGQLMLEGNQLNIQVDSENRLEQIKRKISRRLGKRATFENVLYQPMDTLLEDSPDLEDFIDNDDILQSSEIQDMVSEISVKYWTDWLDTPMSEISHQTPRQAAQSKKGRELLEGLLLEFQKIADKDPRSAPDIAMLRRELKME